MEFEPSLSWYDLIHGFFFFFLSYNFIIIVILFLLINITILLAYILLIKRRYFHCKCDICYSYVTSSWSNNFSKICDWYANLLQNSPSKTIHIHVLDNIITANPSNVEYMLKTNFNNYPKGKPFSTILGDLLGHGIFNVDGDAWRFQRKMASLELDRCSVRSYSFQAVKEEIDNQLMPYLYSKVEGQVVDLQEIFRAFSLGTISKFSFGVKIEPLLQQLVGPFKDFSTSFDLATKLSAERALEVCSIAWKLKRFLGIGKEKKLKDAVKVIDIVAMEEVIKQRRKKLGTSLSQEKDLLSRFMESVKDNDCYLRDIIVSFLLAGRDTMASTLTSFFLLIAKHPQVETNILTEADRVLGQGQGIVMYDQIGELTYLQAAVFESMRLYPPVQFDSKFALNNDVLPDMMNTKVMKGTRVTYHPYAMGRMEVLWGKDCLEFKPERWLDEDRVFIPQNPYKYPVFQAGNRVCLGKEMALMEIKYVALSLLRDFHFVLANSFPSHVPRFAPGLTATFDGGLPVTLCTRKKYISCLAK
ncbi:cytochrome P450 94C1-like [Chenopodium quinoa]|uniref:cytochrome P450 94C1-like n=1 Tax=Chenopodium quinoa TaxID=63459 RepID=UPI000B77345D|nr:cytochrome P450 94C1-like [Chenopodium quinoa]